MNTGNSIPLKEQVSNQPAISRVFVRTDCRVEIPTFAHRSHDREWMDDLSISDERLRKGLEGLRSINRWLGGYSALWSRVRPYLELRQRVVRILDIGAGGCDVPGYLIRRADRMGTELHITAVDINPAALEYADEWLRSSLTAAQFDRIDLVEDDLFSLNFENDSFDLCTASLFLHHLSDRKVVEGLQRMGRFAADGCVVNDLHRTPAAYYGLLLINGVFSVPEMVRHDGPVSVLRGFRRRELERLAVAAGCTEYSIDWHWAFRWTLSTISL